MSTGLIALLDDVAAIAKVAAAQLDDVAAQAGKAGAKAAGVVIDDAAVTPRYVVGFAASRELPIVARIAAGSLKNKLLFLLPAALLLSVLAPFLITPLLMLGGAYLCYEGAEKVVGALWPHAAHAPTAAEGEAPQDAQALEDAKVRSAIQTDFILSAEIMAITLGSMPEAGFWMQAVVLAVVGLGITVIVYGAVALIVKADDAGLALARQPNAALRALGRGLVRGMPVLLRILALVGTAAMVWVGGGIILHGLEEFGLGAPAHLLHDAAVAVAQALAVLPAVSAWLVGASGAGLFGLLIGAALIPLVARGTAVWRRLRGAPAAPH
jgi:hypothetical protein